MHVLDYTIRTHHRKHCLEELLHLHIYSSTCACAGAYSYAGGTRYTFVYITGSCLQPLLHTQLQHNVEQGLQQFTAVYSSLYL